MATSVKYAFILFDNWNAEWPKSSLQFMMNYLFPVSLSYIIFRNMQKPLASWLHMLTLAVKIPKSQVLVGFKAIRHSLKKFKLRKAKKVVKYYAQFFDAPDINCVWSSLWSLEYFQHDMWLIKYIFSKITDISKKLLISDVIQVIFWKAFDVLSSYKVSSQFDNSSRF